MPALAVLSTHPSFSFDIVYTPDWDGHRPYAEAAFGFGAHAATTAGMHCATGMTALESTRDYVLHPSRSRGTADWKNVSNAILAFSPGAMQEGCRAMVRNWTQTKLKFSGVPLARNEPSSTDDYELASRRVFAAASCALPLRRPAAMPFRLPRPALPRPALLTARCLCACAPPACHCAATVAYCPLTCIGPERPSRARQA
jgi:hypothetical protein